MPKVFKPKIRPSLIHKNRKNNENNDQSTSEVVTTVVDNNPNPSTNQVEKPVEKPIEIEVVESSVVENQSVPEEITSSKTTNRSSAKRSSASKSDAIVRSPQPINVDIDEPVSRNSASKTSSKASPIKLFEVKQAPRQHHSFGDTPPPIDKPLDRSTVTLRSLLNWVPVNKPPPRIRDINPNPPSAKSDTSTQPKSPTPVLQTNPKQDEPDAQDISDEAIDPFAPQVRLDADGNIVLDEQSLRIERPVDESTLSRTHVAEEAGLYGTTYNSFRRRPIQNRGRKWTEKDTTRFYRALSTIGTDFYSMTKLFPDRTRSQLLKKFKREERLFPHLVDDALKNKRNYDITVFYTSESENENYDKLTKEAIKEKRKAARTKKKATSEPKPRSTCDISALIDEVLTRDATTSNSNPEEEDARVEDDKDSDESDEILPQKIRRLERRGSRFPRVSLDEMIEKTANEATAATTSSPDSISS